MRDRVFLVHGNIYDAIVMISKEKRKNFKEQNLNALTGCAHTLSDMSNEGIKKPKDK